MEFDSKFTPMLELEKRGIKAVEDVKPQFELLKTRVSYPKGFIDVGANSNTGFLSGQNSIASST
jgi:predicted rRNA methylase YqxC with S4 and FtsJ domains